MAETVIASSRKTKFLQARAGGTPQLHKRTIVGVAGHSGGASLGQFISKGQLFQPREEDTVFCHPRKRLLRDPSA